MVERLAADYKYRAVKTGKRSENPLDCFAYILLHKRMLGADCILAVFGPCFGAAYVGVSCENRVVKVKPPEIRHLQICFKPVSLAFCKAFGK
jgi:hypothetical protein